MPRTCPGLRCRRDGGPWRDLMLYASDLFEAATIGRIAGHLARVLEQVAVDPERRIGGLELMDADERERILVHWNATRKDYPLDRGVHELIAARAVLAPDAIALADGSVTLSYAELDRRSNQLARHLQAQGVGPEVIVGLCLERSAEMVVAMLGILKAGGAYLPIDPAYPQERIAFMLADAQVPVLVTSSDLDEDLPSHWGRTILIDEEWPSIDRLDPTAPECSAGPSNLAYVIYTSGSTGTPKGVMRRTPQPRES